MKYKKLQLIFVQSKIFSNNYRIRLINLILIFVQSSNIIFNLDFTFQSLATIIIYVGAISILFIFVIKLNSPNTVYDTYNNYKFIFLLLLIFSIFYIYFYSLTNTNTDFYEYNLQSYQGIYFTLTNQEFYGIILYYKDIFLIIILGIMLQVVLIGMFNQVNNE